MLSLRWWCVITECMYACILRTIIITIIIVICIIFIFFYIAYNFFYFITYMIMTQNIFISTLFDNLTTGNKRKWVIMVAMQSAVLVFMGLFKAENTPLKQAIRFDLPVQAALHLVTGVSIHMAILGHLRHLFNGLMVKSFVVTCANVVVMHWLVPVTIGSVTRSVYRKHLRKTERLKCELKQKKFA